jgi:hypothetical protein
VHRHHESSRTVVAQVVLVVLQEWVELDYDYLPGGRLVSIGRDLASRKGDEEKTLETHNYSPQVIK